MKARRAAGRGASAARSAGGELVVMAVVATIRAIARAIKKRKERKSRG